jgi:uncharacterized protein YndB with AHSA1/START domain
MTRRISAEIEVPGTPEEVWDAIGTAAGISAWFVPTEIDGDRMTQRHGADLDSTSRIVAADRPRRFAYEDEFQPAPDAEARTIATEFLVEARTEGTCVVRVVQSGFGDGEAWERALESFQGGWRGALDDLRIYLTRFPGQPSASFALAEPFDGDWPALRAALGLPEDAEPGDRVATHDAPPFGGTVARVEGPFLALELDRPAPGIGFVGAGGPGAQTYLFVRGKLFGDDAPARAAEAERAWREWIQTARV